MSESDYATRTILLVDDDPADCARIEAMLGQCYDTYDLTIAHTSKAGFDAVNDAAPDCVLVDYKLPDLDGLCFFSELRRHESLQHAAVIMLTGMGDEKLAGAAFRSGIQDFLPKQGLTAPQLEKAIRTAVADRQLQVELESQRHALLHQNHELQRRHELFSRYWNDVAHSLLTPLSAVQEFLSIVLDELPGAINEAQGKYLAMARGSCHRLDQQIAQLANLGDTEREIDSGAAGRHSLQIIVEQAIEHCELHARVEGVTVSAVFHDTLPDVHVDRFRLAQVLHALVSRSVRLAGRKGRVTVNCTPTETGREVAVHIRGGGVIASRLAGSDSDLFQDLHICRSLVAMQGGDLLVTNDTTSGLEFSFRVPAYEMTKENRA